MTAITHTFVSTVADSTDATLVLPSNWNDDHVITGNSTVPSTSVSTPFFGTLQQNWATSTTTFTAFKVNVTNTAADTASRVFDFQFGGSSFFYNDTTDGTLVVNQLTGAVTGTICAFKYNSFIQVEIKTAGAANSGYINVTNAAANGINFANPKGSINFGGASQLLGDGAFGVNVLNSTTANAFRVYNTTDSNATPANYERGVFDWTTTANVLTIGTQAAGTGTLRGMALTLATIGTTNPGVAGQLYRTGNAVQISTG